MRILVDARNAQGSGIDRYSNQLVEHLQGLDTEHEYVVLLGRPALEAWEPRAPNFRAQSADHPIYGVGEQAGLLGTLRSLRPDLVHFTSFNAPILYGGRRVTTVHDLTYLDFPVGRDASPLGRARYKVRHIAMQTVLKTSLRRSSAVITDTEYVRRELLRRYEGVGLSAERTVAIHCGAPQRRERADTDVGGLAALPADVSEPYLLYVGHAYPHKNLHVLIDALEILRRRLPEARLVLAGPPDSFYEELRQHARGRPEVTFAGFVPEAVLTRLYMNAGAFVLPSLSEGFGLPALEAMSHGCPVLSSRATCLPEVCGDAAEYFDPRDAGDLARKAEALLSSDRARERLRQAGYARAGEFSWRRTAERTLEVYERVLSSTPGAAVPTT